MKLGYIGSYTVQKNKQSIEFTEWVCSEVLPPIMKYGAYITKAKARELFGLIDNDEAEALRRLHNPRGEPKLHYAVVNYKKKLSPCSNHTNLREEPDNTFLQTGQQGEGIS